MAMAMHPRRAVLGVVARRGRRRDPGVADGTDGARAAHVAMGGPLRGDRMTHWVFGELSPEGDTFLVPPPVGQPCGLCEVPIEASDVGMFAPAPYHKACVFLEQALLGRERAQRWKALAKRLHGQRRALLRALVGTVGSDMAVAVCRDTPGECFCGRHLERNVGGN